MLTAIGLPPGGSSTVHICTQTIRRTTQNKQYIDRVDTDLPFLTSSQLSVSLDKMSCDTQMTNCGNKSNRPQSCLDIGMILCICSYAGVRVNIRNILFQSGRDNIESIE